MLAARASKTDIRPLLRPLLSCPKSLFQCEAKFEAIDMEMIIYSHSIKTHFHKKRFCSQPRFYSESFGTWKCTGLLTIRSGRLH